MSLALPFFPGVASRVRSTTHACSAARLLGGQALPAANLGGASYVRAVSAVFGDVQFIPTGIDAQTVDDYLAPSSVLAVGGTWMTPPALISGGRYDEIEILAAAAPTAGTRQLAQENH